MELNVRVDELIVKSVTNSQGRTFNVYQLDADGYLVDLSLTKDDRDLLENEIAEMNTDTVLRCLFTSRTFEYNGRTIRVPQAKFINFVK